MATGTDCICRRLSSTRPPDDAYTEIVSDPLDCITMSGKRISQELVSHWFVGKLYRLTSHEAIKRPEKSKDRSANDDEDCRKTGLIPTHESTGCD